MPITPWDYQVKHAKEAAEILKQHMIVYLAWEERTGKSLTSLLIVEQLNVTNVLIVTKKKALGSVKTEEGWEFLLHEYESAKSFELTTYGKAKRGEYDLIILDEAHNYVSGYPKPSTTWKKLKQVCMGVPIIYLSATPHAQGYQLLYHQFALSSWSPWHTYTNFYNWFRHYGIPYTIKVHDKEVNQYTRVQDDLVASCVEHLFSTKTRKELGFKHEPKDQIHYLELSDITKKLYNDSMKSKVLTLGDSGVMKLLDTTITMRTSLHMIEGGVAKVTSSRPPNEEHSVLQVDKEKIAGKLLYHTHYDLWAINDKLLYILETWGDSDKLAIMYQYIGEGIKLRNYFKNARILQATSYAEGVDLSGYDDLVIYSQDFSTARHTQRRARQANKLRATPIVVHFLLVKKAISEQVYKTVSINKVNYVDSRFEKELL